MQRKSIILLTAQAAIQKTFGADHPDYRLISATHADSCREMLHQYQPDILIMEARLPDGNGIEFCQQVRAAAIERQPYLIMLVTSDAEIEAAFAAGADDCWLLPVHAELARHRIAKLAQQCKACVFDETWGSVVTTDADGHIQQVNKPFEEQFQIQAPVVMRQPLASLIAQTDQTMLQDVYKRLKDTPFVTTTLHLKVNDRFYHVNLLVKPLADGGFIHALHPTEKHLSPSPESKYQQMFDAANDGIMLIDTRTSSILDANRRIVRLLGYLRDELLTMTLDQIEIPMPDEHQVYNRLSSTGRLIYEHQYRHKDGSLVPVEISSRVINYDGTPTFLSFIRDITNRKQMENAERRQRQLAEALRDSAAALGSTLELHVLLERILDSVHSVVPSDAANVMHIRDGAAHIVGRRGYAERGLNPDYLADRVAIEERTTLQWVLEHKQPLFVPDVRDYDGWREEPEFEWVMTYLCVPLMAHREVIGFINLDSGTPGQMNQQDVLNLQAFAHQASIALQNAQLYEATQHHAVELEQRVGLRTVELSEAVKLLASERNLLRTLIDNLPDDVYVKNTDGNFILVNETLRRHIRLEAPDREIIGATDFDFMPSHRAAQFRADEETLFRTGQPLINEEIMTIDPDGTRRWMLSTKVPLQSVNGEITGLVGINRDITNLRDTEELLRRVINGANCLLWYAMVENTDGQLNWDINVPDLFAAQRFMPLEQQPGANYAETFYDSVIPVDRERIDATSRAALEENAFGYTQEYRCRRVDGEIRWVSEEVRITVLSSTRWSLVGVIVDITERKTAAEALQRAYSELEQRVLTRTAELVETNASLRREVAERQRAERAAYESQARFQALVEHAPEAIVVFDALTEQFLDANENALRLFGVTYEALFHRSLLNFSPEIQPDGVPSTAGMRQHIRNAVDGATPVFDWMYLNVEGQAVPCEVRLLLLPNSASVLIRGSITDITERKRAEAALQSSEEKYRSLTNQLPVGIYRTSPTGEILYANPALVSILGYEEEAQVMGQSVLPFYLDLEDFYRQRRQYEEAADGVTQEEVCLRDCRGGLVWVRDTARVILNEQGEIAYVDGTLEDITESKRAQQAEQEQRQFAEALRNAAADLSRTLELDEVLDRILVHIAGVMPPHTSAGVLLIEDEHYVNMIRSHRYPLDPAQMQPVDVRFSFAEIPNFAYMYQTAQPVTLPSTEFFDDWVYDPEDPWIKSYVGAPIQAEGQVIGFINLSSATPYTFNDDHAHRLMAFANQVGIAIQNARLYEAIQQNALELRQRVVERTAELDRERTRLSAILDAMTEGVIYHEGVQPIYTNRSLRQLMGYSSGLWQDDNIMAQLFQMTEAEMELFKQRVSKSILQTGIWRGQFKLRHEAGYEFDASLITTLVSDGSGQPMGAVTVFRDVSQEKQIELQKTRFIANASHELRTPIANLKTRLYLIRHQPTKWQEHFSVMENVTDRMRKLVEELLDMSRFEHGMISLKRQVDELQPLIQEVVDIQQPEAEARQLVITCEMPSEPVLVLVDKSRIQQVLTNLITNAINYAPQGSVVRVRVFIQGEDVQIDVQDSGGGIPMELMPYLFKPFVRGTHQSGGTGLGLSIAREIVELHGGTISVQSDIHTGTCFSVRLRVVNSAGEQVTLK